MKAILLNRMYVGTFLKDNIGHEVINLFKDDNGSNYIYVNPYGRLGKNHNDIESILLVRGINATTVEIIAKAEGLTPVLNNSSPKNSTKATQKKYIDKHEITYGGVELYRIYQNNVGDNDSGTVYISFKAKKFYIQKIKSISQLIAKAMPERTNIICLEKIFQNKVCIGCILPKIYPTKQLRQ